MLYYLLYHLLQKYFSPLNVFRYITVRTVYASLTAMFLALVFGPWLIRRLRELQIGQYIREEGPQEHKKKAGTPTMSFRRSPSRANGCRAEAKGKLCWWERNAESK